MTYYAIWYGNLLDGVTRSEIEAKRAEKKGATVIAFECPDDGPVEMSTIPEPGLPLGWQESEVVT